MHLPVLTRDTAPAESQQGLDEVATDIGFLPNFAATIAASPTLLAGFNGLRAAINAYGFDPVHREIAGIAVGVAVDNAYGVAFHATVLARLGVEQEDLETMRRGAEPRDDLHAAVYAFARALVLDRGAVAETVVRRALDAGLQPADLLQLVTECVFASLVGIVDNLAGRVELDQPLQAQAWK
jgi:alkylhydroperoxidase family enzyme